MTVRCWRVCNCAAPDPAELQHPARVDLYSHMPPCFSWIRDELPRSVLQHRPAAFDMAIEIGRCLALLGVKEEGSVQQVSTVVGLHKAALSRYFREMPLRGLIETEFDANHGHPRMAT